MNKAKCSVGLQTRTSCHESAISTSSVALTTDQLQILEYRIKMNRSELVDICYHHKTHFLDKYELLHATKCCDPFKKHRKTVRKGLVRVTLNICRRHYYLTLLAPGKRICTNCNKILTQISNDNNLEPTKRNDELRHPLVTNRVSLRSETRSSTRMYKQKVDDFKKASEVDRILKDDFLIEEDETRSDADIDVPRIKMRVGEMYQAQIPSISKTLTSDFYANDVICRETLLWKPDNQSADAVTKYLEFAEKFHKYNEEQALQFLCFHQMDVERAKKELKNQIPCPDAWTDEEKCLFEQALRWIGKDFAGIQKVFPHKTISEIIKYFYLWKNKSKLMKKKTIKMEDIKKTQSDLSVRSSNEIYTKKKKKKFKLFGEKSQYSGPASRLTSDEVSVVLNNPGLILESLKRFDHQKKMCRKEIQILKQDINHLEDQIEDIKILSKDEITKVLKN